MTLPKRFIIIVVLLLVEMCFCHIQAQEPGNNLGKTLSTMKRDFPELRYIKSDAKGDEYEDGYPQDGIAMFFYFRNNIVVEECLIMQDTNGFPNMWFNAQVNAFEKSRYQKRDHEARHYTFTYSSFKVDLIYVEENGKNTAMIVYSPIRTQYRQQTPVVPRSSKTYAAPTQWYQVKITYNEYDVNGLSDIGYIKGKNSPTLFGSSTESEARNAAIQKLQKKAFKKGAKVVLITNKGHLENNFLTVTVEGIMYK